MNVMPYLRLVPQIQSEIVEKQLDTIVIGMGPSAWLLPWIDRSVLNGIRIWGCHDSWRIWPIDDLVVFDVPFKNRLAMGTPAHEAVLNARPKRLWLYEPAAKMWLPLLHEPILSVMTKQRWWVWQFGQGKGNSGIPKPDAIRIDDAIPQTAYISPTGTTTLAWLHGARRIGVLGVDMRIDHPTHQWVNEVDKFFSDLAKDAHEKGGLVHNLSPISDLKRFRTWTPSASSSGPTAFSVTPEPSALSSTASEAAPAATCPSLGCGPETMDGKSAPMEPAEAGGSDVP